MPGGGEKVQGFVYSLYRIVAVKRRILVIWNSSGISKQVWLLEIGVKRWLRARLGDVYNGPQGASIFSDWLRTRLQEIRSFKSLRVDFRLVFHRATSDTWQCILGDNAPNTLFIEAFGLEG